MRANHRNLAWTTYKITGVLPSGHYWVWEVHSICVDKIQVWLTNRNIDAYDFPNGSISCPASDLCNRYFDTIVSKIRRHFSPKAFRGLHGCRNSGHGRWIEWLLPNKWMQHISRLTYLLCCFWHFHFTLWSRLWSSDLDLILPNKPPRPITATQQTITTQIDQSRS